MKRAIAIGIVGAMVFCESVPAFAAPVLSNMAAVKTAVPNMVEQARVRRGRGGAVSAGVALGVIGAIAGAAATRNHYYYAPGYYGPSYYGGPGYYGPAYDPGAAIAAGVIGAAAAAIAGAPYAVPGVGRGRCWIATDQDRNFGYWGWCR